MQALADFELLVDKIGQYEEAAGDLKKTFNTLEPDGQRLALVPQVAKTCFGLLSKSLSECSKVTKGTFETRTEDGAALDS